MIVEQYGIKLKRLTFQDIELVRKWRNHPDIRKRMAFKKHITQRMQEAWFNSINNKFNYYFLIEYKGKHIGVINTKSINLKEMYGEGGIFIWDTVPYEVNLKDIHYKDYQMLPWEADVRHRQPKALEELLKSYK